MSVEDYQAALRAFIGALRQAWNAAGKPSYQELEALSGQVRKRRLAGEPELVVLATSTVHGILMEQRVHPPKWSRVLTLVLVLHEAARRAGTDPVRIGSVGDWKQRHEALCALEQAIGQLTSVGGGRAGALGPAQPDPVVPLQPAVPAGSLDDAEEDARLGEVIGLVRRAGEPQWWHAYRDVLPDQLGFYLHLESIANVVRMYKTRAVPGLLQAEGYADALLRRLYPDASEREIARRVELRMHRQQMFAERNSCQLWVIMEEAAVRNQHVGASPMRAQLRHLIEVTEQPNIRLQVLRDDSGDNDTIKEPLTIFRFPEPHVGDVVFLGPGQPNRLLLHERRDVEHYHQVLGRLAIRGRTVRETTVLLRQILADT